MTTHDLLTINEYAWRVAPMHPSQQAVIVANVAVGNAVGMCSCGNIIAAPEYHQVISRFVAHTRAAHAAERHRNP